MLGSTWYSQYSPAFRDRELTSLSLMFLVLVSVRGAVGLLFRVLSLSLIGDISNIPSVSIDTVGYPLESAIRKGNIVGSTGFISIPALILAVVVVGVVILHCPVEGVAGRLVRIGRC